MSAVDPVLGTAQAYSTSNPALPAETALQVASLPVAADAAQTQPAGAADGQQTAAAPQASATFDPSTIPADPITSPASIPVPAPRNAMASTGTDAVLAFAAPSDPIQTASTQAPLQLAAVNPNAALSGGDQQQTSLDDTPETRKQKREAALLAAKTRQPTARQIAALPQDASATGGVADSQTLEDPGAPIALPGVSAGDKLFGITHEEAAEEDDGYEFEVAALGSLTRLSPNGVRTQTDQVEVGCFGPELLSILNTIKGHYGREVVVTSGFRDSRTNRRAGGARKSMHVLCKAADIQVKGVSKWDLAKYLRTVSGRGGVGTYCRTNSVHIDVGPERDWHYPCRRTKKKRA